MNQPQSPPAFVRRFESVRSRLLRIQLGWILCKTLLLLLCGWALLALADYAFEFSWSVRAAGLAFLGIAILLGLGFFTARLFRQNTRPQTAAEIENRFPQLGQSVRTTVQFGGWEGDALRAEGIEPNLAAALEEETARRALPLPIDVIVPARRLKVAFGLVCGAIILIVAAAGLSWEWRTAARRALLQEIPYTRLALSPGHVVVDEGDSLIFSLELTGHTDRDLILETRPAGGSPDQWTRRKIAAADLQQHGPRAATYEGILENITKPIEYRVTAGPVAGDVFRVDVRYPIQISQWKIATRPPEYTALEPETIEDGSFEAIAGTTAAFQITTDRAPAGASLVVWDRFSRAGRKPPQPVKTVPLDVDGNTLSTEILLTEDIAYSIVATSDDGTRLKENRYRIRVRRDRPPEISFDEPDRMFEVHPLAEIVMRIRVQDDFGLAASGIVFEINNEEEHQLLSEDFRKATGELKQSGRLSPRTRATLEKVLPLEYFQLTQKDSVAYYAFAVDNHPQNPNRAVTDLRFIDIRPFKRAYRMLDGQRAPTGGLFSLASLEELIARQRFALNRTLRMSRRATSGEEPELRAVDSLIDFETSLAEATAELALFISENDVDGGDLLFQAVDSMRAAADSLAAGKYAGAVLQEKDALRYLVEGRSRINISISGEIGGAMLMRLLSFDLLQMQKLRRPDRDEDSIERMIARFEKLAEEEDFVANALDAVLMHQKAPLNPEQSARPDDMLENKASGNNRGNQQPGQEEQSGSDADTGMTRKQIADKQLDLSLEAHDLERIMQNFEGLTDLTRTRLRGTAQSAGESAGALERGDTELAAESARRAADVAGELARHLRALLAPEAAKQIAGARNLTDQLAQRQRELSRELSQQNVPADPTAELADRADRLAEAGKTVGDILQAVLESDNADDANAVRRLDELMQEEDVSAILLRMEDLPPEIRAGRLDNLETETADIADRLEVLTRRLDELHRGLIMPRVEELMALERRINKMRRDLDRLQTDRQITDWHRDAEELLEEVRDNSIALEARRSLRDAMRQAGWETDRLRRRWDWESGAAGYRAVPDDYHRYLQDITGELLAQIQELVIGRHLADREEPVPPQYRRLVERFYEVLSADDGRSAR